MGQWISKQIPQPAGGAVPDPSPALYETLNINDNMKKVVTASLSEIPEVGFAVGLIVDVLWPDSGNKTLTWDQIAAGVKSICQGLIDEAAVKDLRDETEGLYDSMKDYHNTAYDQRQKGEKLTDLLEWFIHNRPKFMNQKPWLTLQYFVPMATLHLTMLREQWLFWDKIYPEDKGKYTADHLEQLSDAMTRYIDAAKSIHDECMDWRMKSIFIDDWHGDGMPWIQGQDAVSWIRDDGRGIQHPVWRYTSMDGTEKANTEYERQKWFWTYRDYADQVYRQQIDEILSPSLQWQYFMLIGDLPDVKQTITTTTGTMGDGLSTFMRHFNDREFADAHGPITKISIWGGSRPTGIEVFYGGQSSELKGIQTGTEQVIDVDPNENMVRISGNIGKYLDSVSFYVSPSKFIRVGSESSAAFSMGDLPDGPFAFVGWRLRYIFGWISQSTGYFEQFGAVFSHEEVVGKPLTIPFKIMPDDFRNPLADLRIPKWNLDPVAPLKAVQGARKAGGVSEEAVQNPSKVPMGSSEL